jgi:hypothetical protein
VMLLNLPDSTDSTNLLIHSPSKILRSFKTLLSVLAFSRLLTLNTFTSLRGLTSQLTKVTLRTSLNARTGGC